MLRAGTKSIIGGSVRVVAELSDSGAKYTFPPYLGIKISEDDICIMGRALIALNYFLTLILPNKADVI